MSLYLRNWQKAFEEGTDQQLDDSCAARIPLELFNRNTFDLRDASLLDEEALGYLLQEWSFNEQLTNDPADEAIFLQLRQELRKREAEQN